MTDLDPPIDYVDYTRISFPSDRITVRDLRRAHPDQFDVEDPDNFFGDPSARNTIGTIVYLERLLARTAYEAALGKPGDVLRERGLDRPVCVKDLTDLYTQYGVTQGPHQTEQLVRDLESQAVAQATDRPR